MANPAKIILKAGSACLLATAAIAAAPFTGGGSVLAGASIFEAFAGAEILTCGVVGATATAVVAAETTIEDTENEKRKKDKMISFEHGMSYGRSQGQAEIKHIMNGFLAIAAISYYVARCDGEIAEKEQDEIDMDLDAIAKNKDLPASIKNTIADIAHNENMTFDDVKKYLDKVSVAQLFSLKNNIDEIINADGIISAEEIKAQKEFENYVQLRMEDCYKKGIPFDQIPD